MTNQTVSNLFRTHLRVGDLAYQRGDFHSAMSNYEAAKKSAEKLGDRNFESIALVKTAICLSAVKRLDEAEKLICRAMSIEAQSILDANDAAFLHHEFSILLFRLNRIEEGFHEEGKALEYLRQANPANSKLLVLVLKQLAVYMCKDGNFGPAESFIEDAISVARSSPEMGKDSLIYGQLLATHAVLKIDEKKFDDARELYERAITLIQIHEGQWNPKLADLYRIIAKHLKEAGKTDEQVDELIHLAIEVENFNKHGANRMR